MGASLTTPPDSIRFGDDFELNVRAYELRSAGVRLKLSRIPMDLLLILLEHQGELVTREQIVDRIWGKGIFLDTDNSINAAISRIRQVLRDDAEQPRFVQTVTGKGYRFIAPIQPFTFPTASSFAKTVFLVASNKSETPWLIEGKVDVAAHAWISLCRI